MASDGFIKVHRSFLEWEWHDDANMVTVFLHCLLLANWKDGRYHGRKIPRGSFVTSYAHLAEITGLPKTTVNRCLHRLEETQEIELAVEHFYTVVTVRNYAVFQQSDETERNELGTQTERKRNANGTQMEPIEERKKERREEVIKKNTKRKSSFKKREEILPDYWNPDPKRNGDQTPASPEEIEEMKKILKGEKKDDTKTD